MANLYGLWDWVGICTSHGTYESRSCPFPLGRPVSRKAGKTKNKTKNKNVGYKGEGGSPIKSFKFCGDNICNNANSLPGCQKPAFLTFRNFPGEACLQTPYLIFHQKGILPHQSTTFLRHLTCTCINKPIKNNMAVLTWYIIQC